MEENKSIEIVCPYNKCPDYGLAKICYLDIYPNCNIVKNKSVYYISDGRYIPDFPLFQKLETKTQKVFEFLIPRRL